MANRAFVATRKGLFTVDRTAAGWRVGDVAHLGDNLSIVTPDPRDGSVYAAIGHGHFGVKMHRSTDAGRSWQPIGTPAYPPYPQDRPPETDPFGRPVPWTLHMVWCVEPGGADEPGTLWAGTLPGGLFVSRDSGQTWELNRPLWDHPSRRKWMGGGYDVPGIHSICVDPRDSRHVTVGVSCGGAWVTRDGGQTWACKATGMRAAYVPPEQAGDPDIQDPHRLVACPADPDVMWVQHHNGIFRSTDAAESWHEVADVAPSTFGFAVAVHPSRPDTAWFVPAIKDERRVPVDGKLVVTRTTNGGKTFTACANGLPQDHAYDLVYRHALDVDGTGDTLMLGSTTGSLWVSEDGGDRWQTVSTHLPPVHCVRFG
jgi:hypothetical protein